MATELNPEDGAFHAGRTPPGDSPPRGSSVSLQVSNIEVRLSFNGSSMRVSKPADLADDRVSCRAQWLPPSLHIEVRQASTGPASFNGPSMLQRAQRASMGPAIFNRSSNLQRLQLSSMGPAGPITDQKDPKSPKTDQTPGKPDAGIALQGQITLV